VALPLQEAKERIPKTGSLGHLRCAIVKGQTQKAALLTEKCLQEGLAPAFIVEEAILKALGTVEEKWKVYEYFIPNVLVSALAIQFAMNVLRPILSASGNGFVGRVVVGTVQGDVHDIGKNLVRMFLEGAGFQVIDLGVDVSPEQFVRAVRKEKPDLLLLSCLYSVTMHAMEDTLIALKKAGLRERVKTLVGGAPVTQAFADSIGADGFGTDAAEGVRKAKEMMTRGAA
jgi:5-methyltetrahydrofolate--homocysteine methyltransferase